MPKIKERKRASKWLLSNQSKIFFLSNSWMGNQKRERKQAGTNKIAIFGLVPVITTRNTKVVEDIAKIHQSQSGCLQFIINQSIK